MSAPEIANAGTKARGPSEMRPIAPNTPATNHATNQPQPARWLLDGDSCPVDIACVMLGEYAPKNGVRSQQDRRTHCLIGEHTRVPVKRATVKQPPAFAEGVTPGGARLAVQGTR
jgi:hypothetical protein